MTKTTPKFEYIYSFIYDKQWHAALGQNFVKLQAQKKYKSFIKKFTGVLTLERVNLAFKYLSESLGLDWKTGVIKVYFVNVLNISGFSDPLTLKISPDMLKIAHTLIHEAVHVLLVENRDKTAKVFAHLKKAFPDADRSTRVHLVVNSSANRVFEQIFGKEEAERAISIERNYKGLKESYYILDNLEVEGNIIQYFGGLSVS